MWGMLYGMEYTQNTVCKALINGWLVVVYQSHFFPEAVPKILYVFIIYVWITNLKHLNHNLTKVLVVQVISQDFQNFWLLLTSLVFFFSCRGSACDYGRGVFGVLWGPWGVSGHLAKVQVVPNQPHEWCGWFCWSSFTTWAVYHII